EHLIDNHSDGAYAVLRFTAPCPHAPKDLQVTYRLFFDIDPQHKGLLRLEAGGATRTAIFSPATAQQTFTLARPKPLKPFLDYFATGVEHIWKGYDHILFLLSLLLPAVVVRSKKRWMPSEGFRAAFIDVVKIVTAFTVAHSLTLTLATLQVVSLPARISESAIPHVGAARSAQQPVPNRPREALGSSLLLWADPWFRLCQRAYRSGAAAGCARIGFGWI